METSTGLDPHELLGAVAADLAALEAVARKLDETIGTFFDDETKHRVIHLRAVAAGLADSLHQLAVRLRQEAEEGRKSTTPAL
jgi:hypothetical protein